MLDVRRLLVLRAVAQTGSLSAAARLLDYTQPAVTHHVRRLEREAGTALVLRAGRGVRLTEAGRVLAAHADVIAARLATAEEQVAAIAGLRAGRVRLAAFPSACAALVPHAVAALRATGPGVEVSLTEAEPPEALTLLRGGEVDLALTFSYRHDDPGGSGDRSGGPVPGDDADGGLVAVPLLTDHLLAALPAGHPLAADGPVRLAELAAATWIAGCERCRGHLLHACAAAGFAPQIAFATDDYVAVQRLVAAGVGVALMPALVTRTVLLPGVAIRPLARAVPRDVAAMLPSADAQPPAVAAMLDALRAAVTAEGVAAPSTSTKPTPA